MNTDNSSDLRHALASVKLALFQAQSAYEKEQGMHEKSELLQVLAALDATRIRLDHITPPWAE